MAPASIVALLRCSLGELSNSSEPSQVMKEKDDVRRLSFIASIVALLTFAISLGGGLYIISDIDEYLERYRIDVQSFMVSPIA